MCNTSALVSCQVALLSLLQNCHNTANAISPKTEKRQIFLLSATIGTRKSEQHRQQQDVQDVVCDLPIFAKCKALKA